MPDYSSGYLKIVITCLVIGLAAGILIFSAAVPLVRKIRVTQEEIQKTKVRYAEISGKIEKLSEIEKRLAAIDSEAPDVKNLFLVREEAVNLVESLETAVSKAGLSGKLSIVDREEDAGSSRSLKQPPLVKNLIALEEVPYVLRFSGSYRQIVDLLQYLENLPYFTVISALSSSAQLDTSQTGKTEAVQTGDASGEINGVLFLRTNEKNEQN